MGKFQRVECTNLLQMGANTHILASRGKRGPETTLLALLWFLSARGNGFSCTREGQAGY